MPPLDELDQAALNPEEDENVDIPAADIETPVQEEKPPTPRPIPEEAMGALIDVESKGKGTAVSSKGALGRTQIMPVNWGKFSDKPFDPKDTEEQDRVGLVMLTEEYTRFKHNMPLALAAYNAGSPAVIRALKSAGYSLSQAASVNFDDIKQYLPGETQKYVPNILGKIDSKKKFTEQVDSQGPITAGTKEEADAAITEIISQPDFNTIGAPAAAKQLKQIYDSRPYWTKEAQDTFKRVSTTIWKSALSHEKPKLGGMIGAPPTITKEDKDPDKTLAAWKTQTTAELEQLGLNPILLGQDYDDYFKDAGEAEKAALEYRERSALGQGYNWATGSAKAIAGGAISNITGAAAAVPRLFGAEETADFIESGATLFGTPTPDFFYEVDENGRVKFDEYGKPLTKIQGTIMSAVGQGVGLLAGGWGLKLAGAGVRTIAMAMGGTNVLNTGNEAYKDAIDNGGTPAQARMAALSSVPSAAVDTLGDMYVVGGGKAWVKGMSKFDKARFLSKEAGKAAAVEGSTEAIQQEMQDLGTSQAIGQDITSGKRVLEAGIGGAAAGAVIGAATAPFKGGPASPGQLAAGATAPSPNREEHIRLGQELTKFKDSPDMSTVLTIRSKEDVDPELFDLMGMRATLLPGNKIRVDKKIPYTAPEVDTADDTVVNSQMQSTAETLSKEPPATIEYANELAQDQEMLNSRWKDIPESVKKDIPFIQELIDKHKKVNEEIRQIIAVEGEVPANPTLGSDLRNLQKEAAVIGQYLSKNEDVAVAARILRMLKSNQNKLDNMVRAEYPHELTEQENQLRQLVAASKALVSEATGETATPDEQALQGEIQKLVDESLTLQQQTGLYEKPLDEAGIANAEEHIIASIRDNKKWGNYDIARMMQKRLDNFRVQQALYKADPELAARLKEQFKRIVEIRDEVTKLKAKSGKALTREQSHIVDVYGSPMPSEYQENFEEWSAGYQVFDVYHGTPWAGFNEFSEKALGSNTQAASAREGYFAAGQPEIANVYTEPFIFSERQRYSYTNKQGKQKSIKRYIWDSLVENDLQNHIYDYDIPPYNLKVPKTYDELTQEINKVNEIIKSDQTKQDNAVEAFEEYASYLDQIRESVIQDYYGADEKFKTSALAGPGVYPLKLRAKNPKIIDADTEPVRKIGLYNIVKQAKDAGHDAVVIKNLEDPKKGDVYVWFDPSQVRSIYAKFEKGKETSPELSASPMPSETETEITQPARNGIPIKTTAGVKLIIPVEDSWYVGDASGNITGGKHKRFYDAAKEVYSQDVMSKPPLPIWSSIHRNPSMRVVDANFTPAENIPRTSTTQINPRDIYKLGKKILKTIFKTAQQPIAYNMREGGREERGMVGKVLGYASHRQRYIYLKYSNDPTTLVHEVAHAISNDLMDLNGLPHEVKVGLVNQAATFYGDPNLPNFPLDRILSEGFSNFIEHYSSGQPVDMRVLDFYNTTFKATLPGIHEAIEDVKNLTKSYISMDPFTRAKVFTSANKERKKKKPGFAENYIDMQRVFHDFDLKAGTDIRDTAEYVKGQGQALAQEMVNGEYFHDSEGNRVAGALTREQILSPVKKRLDDVVAYMAAKYTIARQQRGQTTGFPIEDALDIVRTAEIDNRANYEEVILAANRLWHWQDDVLDVAASRSPLFAEIIDKIRASNLRATGIAHGFYIPFSREFEVITDLPKGRAKTEDSQNPFMRFTGSTKRTANPLLLMQDWAQRILTAANKNFVLNQALAVADAGLLPVTEYIREIPKQNIPAYKTSVENILQSMTEQIDPEFSNILNSLDPDTLLKLVTLYAPEKTPPAAADGFVTVAYRQAGGRLCFYEVSPEFIRAFDESMPDLTNNPIFKWMWIMPNVIFKLGATTFRMSYQMRNLLFRDFMTGYFRTKSINPISFARDVMTALAQEFAVSSGLSKAFNFRVPWVEFSKRLGMQTATLYRAGRDLEQDIEKASGKKVITLLNTPLNYLENVLSSGERATRLVAAKYKAKELGVTDPDQPLSPEQNIEIALAYKRATTNFQVQGRKARFINLGVPFFTARIAEVSQMERDWNERRPRMMKFALAYLTLGLYQALANKDDKWWQNLEPEERAVNFLTTVGDKIVRIPLSSLGGLFNGFGNMIGDAIVRQDLLKPSIAEHVYAIAKNYAPITHVMDLAGVVGKEAAQQALNKDFFTDRNIVPRGLEEAPTASQYTAATTELAKELGRIIGYPPAKIDHALRGVFPAGLDVLKQWENITGIKPITDQSKSLAGVFASAVTRSGFVTSSMDRSTERFYDIAAKYRANKDIETRAEGNIRKSLNKLQDQLSSINIVLSAEPDQETRKDLYEKKAQILEQGLRIVAGETAPVVRKISEENKAKNLRAIQQRERAQRQRQQEEKELSLE